jgi:hypothetical protein
MRARWIVVHPRAQCILAIINPPQALAKVNSCQFFFFVSCRYSSGWLLVPFLIFHDQHRDPKWCIRFQRLKTSRPAARASSPGGLRIVNPNDCIQIEQPFPALEVEVKSERALARTVWPGNHVQDRFR